MRRQLGLSGVALASARAPSPASARALETVHAAAGWGLVALCLALPFETLRPALRLGRMGFTGLELVLLAAVALAALSAALRGRACLPLDDDRSRLFAGFAALAVLSAAVAAADQELGLKHAARWVVGVALFVLARPVLAQPRWRRRVALALAASALGSAAVAGLCLAGARLWSPELLGPGVGWYGPYARASGSFLTANTLAHYLVTLLPLLLGFAATLPALPALSLTALAAAILALTLSRVAWLVGLGVMLAWPALAAGLGLRGTATRRFGLVALGAMLLVIAVHRPARIRAGVGSLPSFRVAYQAPTRVEAQAGRPVTLDVSLSVTTRDAAPGEGVTGLRCLIRRVAPDATSHREGPNLRFEAMAAGRRGLRVGLGAFDLPGVYAVMWEAVIGGRHNASALGSPPATTELLIYRDTPDEPAVLRRDTPALEQKVLEDQTVRERGIVGYTNPPSRAELWGAAAALIAARPWLGVGPDHFRLESRPLVTRSVHDDRMSAHSVLLELGATLGLPALGLFVAAVGRILIPALWALRAAPSEPDPPRALAAVGVVAMLAHSLLDYFLGFTAMYALLFLLLALADSGRQQG